MGARSSCAIFERFATALQYILYDHYKVKYVVKMLHDFFFVGKSREECLHGLNSFLHLCRQLNLPIAEEKTVFPAKQVVFLGIQLDTNYQVASIPKEKAAKYAEQIRLLSKQRSVSMGQLREITGKLEHVTAIIKGGKAFLRRLHSAKRGPQLSSRRIFLSSALKEDLELWCHFPGHLQFQNPVQLCPTA